MIFGIIFPYSNLFFLNSFSLLSSSTGKTLHSHFIVIVYVFIMSECDVLPMHRKKV